jgi:hypothetical protein
MTTYANTSYAYKNVGTSAVNVITSISSGTVAIASLIVSNTTNAPITTSVYITRSSTNYYLVYQATIPVGGSLECIQGSRVVMIASDALYVQNSVASSGDVWISALTAQ